MMDLLRRDLGHVSWVAARTQGTERPSPMFETASQFTRPMEVVYIRWPLGWPRNINNAPRRVELSMKRVGGHLAVSIILGLEI